MDKYTYPRKGVYRDQMQWLKHPFDQTVEDGYEPHKLTEDRSDFRRLGFVFSVAAVWGRALLGLRELPSTGPGADDGYEPYHSQPDLPPQKTPYYNCETFSAGAPTGQDSEKDWRTGKTMSPLGWPCLFLDDHVSSYMLRPTPRMNSFLFPADFRGATARWCTGTTPSPRGRLSILSEVRGSRSVPRAQTGPPR